MKKKIKGPWYALLWIGIWSVSGLFFWFGPLFQWKEKVGLVIVCAILIAVTLFLLAKHYYEQRKKPQPVKAIRMKPSLNAPCPCGSGKKYKRCCGAPNAVFSAGS